MDLFLKLLGALIGLVSVSAAVYNVLTARAHAKQIAHETHMANRLETNIVLAAKTDQRVTALEGRLGSFEQRIEHRIDQIAGDIGKVKDMFTDYLIKH